MRKFLIGLLFFTHSYWLVAQMSYEESKKRQQSIPRENSEWAMQQPYVILISIDGFRYDYAAKFGARNIAAIGENGATVDRMIPSFPSKTFPNHITLITGKYPANHGIVSNEFYSRSRDEWYAVSNRGSIQNGEWYNGKPLWVLAEEQGMLSASYFWVGSEAVIDKVLPSYYYSYSGKVPNAYRTRQVLEWLNLAPEVRPHFITLYFSLVDDAGHDFGPDAPETRKAVLEIDSLIGVFMKDLALLSLPINVVLVSDHGMSTINNGIVLSDLVDLSDSKVSWSFPPMIYQPDSVKADWMYKELQKSTEVEVFKRSNLPEYFKYKNDDRVGDLIVMSEAPTVIIKEKIEVRGGTHGFDPYSNKEMGGIFYATGPSIEVGFLLDAVENIHVYPFVAELLGLQVTDKIDGELRYLLPAIKK